MIFWWDSSSLYKFLPPTTLKSVFQIYVFDIINVTTVSVVVSLQKKIELHAFIIRNHFRTKLLCWEGLLLNSIFLYVSEFYDENISEKVYLVIEIRRGSTIKEEYHICTDKMIFLHIRVNKIFKSMRFKNTKMNMNIFLYIYYICTWTIKIFMDWYMLDLDLINIHIFYYKVLND